MSASYSGRAWLEAGAICIVDRAGTTEEVVPHTSCRSWAREHLTGMLRKVFQQFELCTCGRADVRATVRVVPSSMTSSPRFTFARTLLASRSTSATGQQPQSGVDLGGPGARKQNLIQTPVHADRDQSTFR